MNESSSPQPSSAHVPLTVLPHSGKVDKLRQEALSERAAPKPPAPPGDGPRHAPHQNRISASPAALKSPETLALEHQIIDALKTVYDPEIPVDIYELGLIYDIDIDPEQNVHVRMTLTAPGCPVAGTMPVQVGERVEAIDGVKSATIELVWDPPWQKEMMSEAARLQLGFL